MVSQTCPPACSEVFNSACIVYTGVDIICNDTTVSPAVPTTIVRRNDYLDTALTAIVQYVCSRFNTQIHPTTVVDSGDAFILVSSDVVGAQTTYTITLDPTNLPQASEVTGGVNVTVTGDGTPTTDPYVVNAQGSIVADFWQKLNALLLQSEPIERRSPKQCICILSTRFIKLSR